MKMELADVETLMKFMREHDMAEVQVGQVRIISRPKPPDFAQFMKDTPQVSDDEILQNPYKGVPTP